MRTLLTTLITEEYQKWVETFVYSARRYLPDTEIKIYTVNFHTKIPGIKTRRLDVDNIEQGQYGRKKVTYLKGQCVKTNLLRGYDAVIWMDISAIFRKRIDLTGDYQAGLVYRGAKSPKLRFCAEFQVWKDIDAAREYDRLCKENRKEWFADQLALIAIDKKFNVKRLPHPEFCNLEYEDIGITWSARAKGTPPANGIHTEEDEQYALEMFRKFLYEPKPRILAIIDNFSWCYATTADKIADELSHKYDFETVKTIEDRRKIRNGEYDLVWCRGYTYRAAPVLDYRPDYAQRTIVTVTTGGELLPGRIKRNFTHTKYGDKVLALVAQNHETIDKCREYEVKKFLIPNGVDIYRFKPDNFPKVFTVGFAARKTIDRQIDQKGWLFVKEACEGIPIRSCDSREERLDHKDMPSFYNSVSVVLQPSHSEGCSNTLHEAMSCGRVCLTTKVGYHGEVCCGDIERPEAEVVFIERDADDIKEKLKILKENPAIYTRISRNARSFAKAHSWEIVVQKFDDMFEWGCNASA